MKPLTIEELNHLRNLQHEAGLVAMRQMQNGERHFTLTGELEEAEAEYFVAAYKALPALLDTISALWQAAQEDILAFYTAVADHDVCACDFCINGIQTDIDCAAECDDRTKYFVWRGIERRG